LNKVYVPKPKETITAKQKARNLRGIRKFMEELKKIRVRRAL